MTYRCLDYDPCKSESEILGQIRKKKNLAYTFDYYHMKHEDRHFEIFKSEKSAESLKAFVKVKDVYEVIQSVKALKTWKTDVRQMPKKITFHPSTFLQ